MAAPTSHWSASPLMSSDILGEMCSMVEIEGMAEDIAVERVQKSLLGVIVVLIQVLDAPTSTVEDKRSLADMLINAMSRIILVSEVIELEIQIIDLSDILMRMDRVPELKSFDWVLMRFEKMAEERRIL
ncbi:hypothetical protein Q9L58_007582 [Maublancomyces gigas]|uniref:Uncharacterized protein n=1 Tax=Discina gigas TaxID=1032678 RepID=A0ABR3GC59_9PEZI